MADVRSVYLQYTESQYDPSSEGPGSELTNRADLENRHTKKGVTPVTALLEKTGDRILGLFVPKVEAGACTCYWSAQTCTGTRRRKCFRACGVPIWCESCVLPPHGLC